MRAIGNEMKIALVLLALVVATVAFGAQQTPTAARERLDAVRQDLVGLEFEKALAALEGLLADATLTEGERTEAWILRAQTYVAYGDLDAAVRDYGEILKRRPAYVPDPALTPKKALERFEKLQRATVGRLALLLDPPDARLRVDGRPVELDADAGVPLLAGRYTLAVSGSGFDPQEIPIEIAAGQVTEETVRLIPNARSVILRTRPEGVEVWLDGRRVGETRPDPTDPYGPASLTLEYLSLEEHTFELRKECYRTELFRDTLTVDLLDRSPKRYEPVTMVPARTALSVRGPEGARLQVDGEHRGTLPLDVVEVCAGEREIELRCSDRTVWLDRPVLPEGVDETLDLTPRPGVVWVGTRSGPRQWPRLAEETSTLATLEARGDLTTPSGWAALELPRGTDLAIAKVAPDRAGLQERWFLYSPVLREVTAIELGDRFPRPEWRTVSWGVFLADSESGGNALVVAVEKGSAAEKAGIRVGDRLLALDGKPVTGSGDAQRALAAAGEGRVVVEWERGGERTRVEIRGAVGPRLHSGFDTDAEALTAAAWAVTDAACGDDAAALANLALLFARFGNDDLAARTWKRVRWAARDGIGAGTVQYYLGVALERLGREQEAVQAYRDAAGSAATAFDDEGPAVGPAARDRLADLGVTSR